MTHLLRNKAFALKSIQLLNLTFHYGSVWLNAPTTLSENFPYHFFKIEMQ